METRQGHNNINSWKNFEQENPHHKTPLEDTEAQDTWYRRIRTIDSMLQTLRNDPDQLADKRIFAYQYQEPKTGNIHPVGLLVLNTETYGMPYLDELITHPGSQRAGSALIEQAVNESENVQKSGRLRLYPLNDTAKAIYGAWGFTKTGVTDTMVLDPENSEKWLKRDGKWHLKSQLSEKQAEGSSSS